MSPPESRAMREAMHAREVHAAHQFLSRKERMAIFWLPAGAWPFVAWSLVIATWIGLLWVRVVVLRKVAHFWGPRRETKANEPAP